MVTLECNLSPLVFAKLYEILAQTKEYEERLTDQLAEIHMSYEWLSEASDLYQAFWEVQVGYACGQLPKGVALSSDHAVFATWLMSALLALGASSELEERVGESITQEIVTRFGRGAFPLPQELSPTILAWTLGVIVAEDGDDLPVIPARPPTDHNAALAFEGLVEHYLLVKQMPEPWPEVACSAFYWRGYGLAEALRPDEDSGGPALKTLQREAHNSTPPFLRTSLSRHLDTFGAHRNSLSHIAPSQGRVPFTEAVTNAQEPATLRMTVQAMSQFVFQEVSRSMRDHPPKMIRLQVWDDLYRDIQIWT